MKFLAYFISVVATNVVAVLASTFILRFKPITWLVSSYGWSEIAINLVAFMFGAVAGLQVARFICRKLIQAEIGPIAVWVLILPFALLGLGEILKNNNLMGIFGAVGALLGVVVFKGMVKEELEKGSSATSIGAVN